MEMSVKELEKHLDKSIGGLYAFQAPLTQSVLRVLKEKVKGLIYEWVYLSFSPFQDINENLAKIYNLSFDRKVIVISYTSSMNEKEMKKCIKMVEKFKTISCFVVFLHCRDENVKQLSTVFEDLVIAKVSEDEVWGERFRLLNQNQLVMKEDSFSKTKLMEKMKKRSRIVAMSFCEPRSCRLQLSS